MKERMLIKKLYPLMLELKSKLLALDAELKAMATRKQFINEAAPALILKANNRFEIVDNHVATQADYNNSYIIFNTLRGNIWITNK
jgi:hypothetical protein